MELDNETWLIVEGDRIIEKKSKHGYESVTKLEKAIYCLWVVDYAVRNSGTLAPVREIHESSISDLISFAKGNNCESLYSMLKLADNEKIFCEEYYNKFDEACEDLRYLNMNGNNL